MALELTPPEPGSLNPRRRLRELSSSGYAAGDALPPLPWPPSQLPARLKPPANGSVRSLPPMNRLRSRGCRLELLNWNPKRRSWQPRIRTLNTERDRLAGRIALLESTIDDMTGTIRFASATTNDPAAQPANQNEFGLELGAGATIEAVRQRWTAQKAGCGERGSARGQRRCGSKPISQCAACAIGFRANKCGRHRHAGYNNCNYPVGKRRHRSAAADTICHRRG